MSALKAILAVLAAHQANVPDIEGYVWGASIAIDCSCGWTVPGSFGVRTVKDGSRSWPDHQRRAVRAALADVLGSEP